MVNVKVWYLLPRAGMVLPLLSQSILLWQVLLANFTNNLPEWRLPRSMAPNGQLAWIEYAAIYVSGN